LRYLIEELSDMYPFFHPKAFYAMYTALRDVQIADRCYFEAIIDALASLGALYLGDCKLSRTCYMAAQDKLRSLNNGSPRGEVMIAYIVLVLVLILLSHLISIGRSRLCK